jgi:hypothetical protein
VATEVGAKYKLYVVKVTSNRGTVKTITAPVHARGLTQVITWRVPKSMRPGTLRFSVQAYGAGTSKKVFAPLVLTRS